MPTPTTRPATCPICDLEIVVKRKSDNGVFARMVDHIQTAHVFTSLQQRDHSHHKKAAHDEVLTAITTTQSTQELDDIWNGLKW